MEGPPEQVSVPQNEVPPSEETYIPSLTKNWGEKLIAFAEAKIEFGSFGCTTATTSVCVTTDEKTE